MTMVRKNHYPNLCVEMTRMGMGISDLARAVGMSRQNLWGKVRGNTTWTLGDMVKVQDALVAKSGKKGRLTLDYLFKSDGD